MADVSDRDLTLDLRLSGNNVSPVKIARTPIGPTPNFELPVQTLDIRETPNPIRHAQIPRAERKPVTAEEKRDHVRLIVTIGLLVIFLWLVLWASFESNSSEAVWKQCKEMLQIILPAFLGLVGSVVGFYFGSKNETLKP